MEYHILYHIQLFHTISLHLPDFLLILQDLGIPKWINSNIIISMTVLLLKNIAIVYLLPMINIRDLYSKIITSITFFYPM